MPLNLNGMMFSFNGDISGMVAGVGSCQGWGLPGSCVVCSPVLWPFSHPPPPRLPLLCSQAGPYLINVTNGFVLF